MSVTIRVSCNRLPTKNVYNTDSMLLDKVKWVELNVIDGAC